MGANTLCLRCRTLRSLFTQPRFVSADRSGLELLKSELSLYQKCTLYFHHPTQLVIRGWEYLESMQQSGVGWYLVACSFSQNVLEREGNNQLFWKVVETLEQNNTNQSQIFRCMHTQISPVFFCWIICTNASVYFFTRICWQQNRSTTSS